MMVDERPVGSDSDPPATEFAEYLTRLKQRGSMLLLVGPAQHTALSRACSRLLGESADTRRPLFVRAGGSSAARDLGSTHARGERARTIQYGTTRSAATADADSSVPVRAVDGDLHDLLEATRAEIDCVRADADDLDPGELRLCVDSLDALLATHDDESAFQFVHGLAGSVHDADAMCHAHLPTSVDAQPVAELTPLFDAVVEVRAGGRPQQRWHVPDENLSTGWLSL